MKVDLSTPNLALMSIFRHPNQIITLDANFLIPPDRRAITPHFFDFDRFKTVWLEPIFKAFPNLAIHEAVYEELISSSIQAYIQEKLNSIPCRVIIHSDLSLNNEEKALRNTIESKIYPYTKYEPMIDNKDDRGEVKSLAYIAVKELIFFAAHDHNVLQLIEKAELWSTGLDNIQAIKMYELIFYLYKMNIGDKKSLRMLYKYQYYLTQNEKKENPEWGEFIERMELLYSRETIINVKL
jgi:hypothetical protein